MQKLVIVYDISNNKIRKAVGDILEGYGVRVNRSVFEILVKNLKTREKLEQELLEKIDPAVDSIRLYTICENCIKSSSVLGDEPDIFDREGIYFF